MISLQQLVQQYGAMLQPTDVVGVCMAAYQLFTEAVSRVSERLAGGRWGPYRWTHSGDPRRNPNPRTHSCKARMAAATEAELGSLPGLAMG
jgi:hypothetical protein